MVVRLLALLILLPALAFGAALPKDPLLEKPVTLEGKKRPVVPLFEEIAKQTGVKLSVEEALRGYAFTLHVRDCPLRDLMAGIEATGTLGWVPEGRGAYRLTVPGIAPPPVEMAKFRAALREACPEWMRPRPGEKSPDRVPRGQGPTLGDRVYALLPEAMRQRLEAGEEIPFPQLPAEAQQAMVESRQSWGRQWASHYLNTSWDPARPRPSLHVFSPPHGGTSLRLVAPAEKGPDGKPLHPPEGSYGAPAGWRTLHLASFSLAKPSDGVPAPPNKEIAEVVLPVARDGGLNVVISAVDTHGVMEPKGETPEEMLLSVVPERLSEWYRWDKAGSVWAFREWPEKAAPGTPEMERARRVLAKALPAEFAPLLHQAQGHRARDGFSLWSRLWSSLTDEQRKVGKLIPLEKLWPEQRKWIETAVQVDLVSSYWQAAWQMLGYDVQQARLSLDFAGQNEYLKGLGCPRTLQLRQEGEDLVYDLAVPSQPPILRLLPGYDPALTGRIDLVAKEEPLSAVAARLGKALGVQVSVPADATARLTGEFRDQRARLVLYWIERETGMQWAKEGAAYVLRPCWNLEGQVADGDGRGVEGARVTVQSGPDNGRSSCVTDAGGGFRLAGLTPGTAFLFVERDGFRFHGQVLAKDAARVEVKLARADARAEPLRSRPGALPEEEETKLALRLAEPILERVDREGLKDIEYSMHQTLMRVAPARMRAASEKANKGEMSDRMRSRLAEELLASSPDEALALIASIKELYPRAYAYLQVSDALPAAEAARKGGILAQALVAVRTEKNPAYRATLLAGVGERLLLLGKKDAAERVLREGEAVAKALPTSDWAGYARAVLAESLALIDLPAALELTSGLTDKYEYDRHHGNIAHKLAGRSPAEAERVYGMMRDERNHDRYGARVCYRMAPADLPRARKVAASIKNPYERAYATGIMAHALAATDKANAGALLKEAFDSLTELAHARGRDVPGGWEGDAAIAGALLPAAEAIDPSRAREYLWRAVACRTERTGRAFARENWSDAPLAMMLARYDLEVAGVLLDAAVAQEENVKGDVYASQRASELICAATAAIDPLRAVALVEALPDDPETARHYERRKERARAIAAGVLSLRGEERWQMLQEKHLHLWIIDKEDL